MRRWYERDLIMWDNQCAICRGTDFDILKWMPDMRRPTVSNVANPREQEGTAVPA